MKNITNQGVNAPSRLPQTTLAAGRRRAASQDQGSATLNGIQQSELMDAIYESARIGSLVKVVTDAD